RASTGRFVGSLALSIPAFAGFPVRRDVGLDPAAGERAAVELTPRLGVLALPRASAWSLRLEPRLAGRVLGLVPVSGPPRAAPRRWLAWGTVPLPGKWLLGPAMGWHSGFPYSVRAADQSYLEPPASRSFPPFFSIDVALQRWVAWRGHRLLVGVGLFDLTGH